jgi:hypothetical protein
MLVETSTFDGMLAEAVTDMVEEVEVRLPYIPHLVAMKLHAVNHGPPHREMGDLHDIIMYSGKTESTLNRKHCRMFFRNTGTPNSMSKFEKPVEDDALALVLAETYEELGFPVALDFDPTTPVVSLSEMFTRGTELLRQTRSAFEVEEHRKQNRCYEEFIL